MAKKPRKTKISKIEEQKKQTTETKSSIDLLSTTEELKLSDADAKLLDASLDNPAEPSEKLTGLFKNKQKESEEFQIDLNKILKDNASVFDKLQKFENEEKKPILVSIDEAAHTLIHGFKEHWLPGIKVRCTLMGMSPISDYPLDEWKNLFIAWGGSGILKK